MGTPWNYPVYCQACEGNMGANPLDEYQCEDCGETLCVNCVEDCKLCHKCQEETLAKIHDSRRRLIKACKGLVAASKIHIGLASQEGEMFISERKEASELESYLPGLFVDVFGEEDYYGNNKKETKKSG